MSGGAYEYFCHKDRGDLFPYKETLEEIAQDMETHSSSDVSDVVAELKDVVALVDPILSRVESLRNVLHAFEWWMSGDYGEDSFQKIVAEWRDRKAVGDG